MKRLSLVLLVVIAVSTQLLLSCSKGSNGTLSSPGQGQITYAVTLSNSPTLGNYLVDKDGYTLYFFANDFKGQNTCQGSCAALWPSFYAGQLTADNIGNGLALSDFDTINVNGQTQTTYKGWPLYYYAPITAGYNTQEAVGQTGGDGYGNVWFVAKPDYTIMLANGQLLGNDGQNYTSSYTVGPGNTLYFTDPNGNTLYTFSHDKANTNTFTLADFSNNSVWPVYETSQIVVPSILNKSLFSTITVFGHTQLTYNGWPLYYFGGDNGLMGSNKGISVPLPGVWPVPVMGLSAAPQ